MISQKFSFKNVPSFLSSHLRLKPYASTLARRMGYELVGEGGEWWDFPNYKFYPRNLSNLMNPGPENPYDVPFKIDITIITSRLGFSYAKDGWHPFLKTLEEYSQNPDLRYQDSTLARLYRQYCPANVQEVLLDNHKLPLHPICDWPPSNELIRWIWALNKGSVRTILKRLKNSPASPGWIFFGPHKQEYGEKEFQRLIKVYNSIKKNGFQKELSETDPVNGYFLKKGTKLRFVLLQGNHRVSVLRSLGYSEIKVLIRKGHPAVIDRAELHRWTEKGGGIYPSQLPIKLFDALFDESGLQKANRYDLNQSE